MKTWTDKFPFLNSQRIKFKRFWMLAIDNFQNFVTDQESEFAPI